MGLVLLHQHRAASLGEARDELGREPLLEAQLGMTVQLAPQRGEIGVITGDDFLTWSAGADQSAPATMASVYSSARRSGCSISASRNWAGK